MMSYTTSAAWSHRVSSPCYARHGQRCGAILSDHITTVAISRSGQLDLRCTIEPNYSGLFARLIDASVTRDRALDTYEPSCVPGVARPFFIPVVHSSLGGVGTWQHWSPPLGEARPRPRDSAEAHIGKEARSGAEEHVTAPELSFRGGRTRSHGTRGSAKGHLSREARSGAEEHVTAPELNSARRRGPRPHATWQHRGSPRQGGEVRGRGTRGGSRAHLYREVWSEATACVVVRGCTPCSLS
jgi:hypothetical protein